MTAIPHSNGPVPARPGDLTVDQTELVAQMFLIGYPENTRRGYAMSLGAWFRWCAFHELEPLHVQRAHIEVWMRELMEKGNRFASAPRPLKPATVNGMVNAVAGFYKFAHRERYIVDDITQYLKRPRVPNESSREGMTRYELKAVLNAARESSPLDYALLCTLACLSGPRISEVCRLDVESVRRSSGYLVVWLDRSKHNRSAEVPVIPMLSDALEVYIGSRTTGPLFLKPRREERLDQKAALRVVKRVVKKAGIDKNITNHSFRHTHITLALNEGMSIRDLTNAMGYADSRQISRYDRDKASLARSSAWVVGAALEGF